MAKCYFILFVVIIIQTLHTLFAGTPLGNTQIDPFPLFDFKNPAHNITWEMYAWFLLSHHFVIALYAYVSYLFIVNTRKLWPVFTFIGLDTMIFILHYSSVWGTVFGLPIGMYLIKIVFLMAIILYQERDTLLRYFSSDHLHVASNGVAPSRAHTYKSGVHITGSRYKKSQSTQTQGEGAGFTNQNTPRE